MLHVTIKPKKRGVLYKFPCGEQVLIKYSGCLCPMNTTAPLGSPNRATAHKLYQQAREVSYG